MKITNKKFVILFVRTLQLIPIKPGGTMKIGIISDIHGNWPALKATLKDMNRKKVDTIFCLGDVVGYGPNPLKCWKTIRRKARLIVKGNHEDGVCNPKRAEEELTELAFAGIEYSRRILPKWAIDRIKELRPLAILTSLNVTLAHSSFSDPTAWEYIEESEEAEIELNALKTSIGFIGHTHIPFVYGSLHGLFEKLPDNLHLAVKEKYLINVGSVGQPRDGDCRASYGIIEMRGQEKFFSLERVFYDIEKTATAIRNSGLPKILAERLFQGR
jgi:predicted phosphodiesterase